MKFRSRGSGSSRQAYPITPRTYYQQHPIVRTPNNILSLFQNGRSHEERLKYKRAAVNEANRAKARGDTKTEKAYRDVIDKMELHPDKAKIGALPKNEYTHQQRHYAGKIGSQNTTLWISDGVSPTSRRQLVKSFNRLPPSAQKEVKHVELVQQKGYGFKVGSNQYEAGGHWVKSENTIRVFGASGHAFSNSADSMIAHEAGHAQYDALCEKAKQETYHAPTRDTAAIRARVRGIRQKKYDELNTKYTPQFEANWNRRQEINRELMKLSFSEYDSPRHKALLKEQAKLEAQARKLSREQDAESKAILNTYDTMAIEERLDRHDRPINHNLSDFRKATADEGGLTPYSDAYCKSHEPTAWTENYAEAMKIWYSGAYTESEAEAVKKTHPKTYAAFQKLVASETQGHAVNLADRPAELSDSDFMRQAMRDVEEPQGGLVGSYGKIG